jgi:hypothetical protein
MLDAVSAGRFSQILTPESTVNAAQMAQISNEDPRAIATKVIP